MKNLKSFLFPALLSALLASCGETEITLPVDGEGTDGTPKEQRELLLTLQNQLLAPATRATRAEIALPDEKRIDALDVYVFGSKTVDGDYTFQEKFSYRSDGSIVPGAKSVIVQGGDGTTATPTVLLRPKKGLFIKIFCVANQPILYKLDNVTAPDAPEYKVYDTFTPLQQSAPGDPDRNAIVTLGIPTETEFCELVTRVVDPAAPADVLEPGLPMLGANASPIDLQDFSLASRLYSSIKLTRAVARFDVVNDASKSRFTIESVGMGNGRSTSSLFPQEALKSAGSKLITWPFRDVTALADFNAGVQQPAFYAYASPKEDAGYLVLKGTYNLSMSETTEVSYNVNFSQVKNGTGSYIEINPNHRYTVTITDADPYRIDFNIRVADWDEGEDLGEYIPENGVSTDLAVTGAGVVYDETTHTITIEKTQATAATIVAKSNAELEAKILYSQTGNTWLEASAVTMADLSDGSFWSYTGTCTVTVGTGPYADYPDATLRLTNKANGTTQDIKIKAKEVAP